MNDNNVLRELQQIKKLLVVLCTKNQAQKEQIKILSNANFQPKEIAELIGTTVNTVNVTLSRLKKGSKKINNDEPKT
jgi:DNA-directed RNA polymerase specialized sigma24 family protein